MTDLFADEIFPNDDEDEEMEEDDTRQELEDQIPKPDLKDTENALSNEGVEIKRPIRKAAKGRGFYNDAVQESVNQEGDQDDDENEGANPLEFDDSMDDDNNEAYLKKREETIEKIKKIEQDFDEKKELYFNEKIDEYNQELEDIKKGTHPELVDRIAITERKKQERMWLADIWRDYQLERAKFWFENELKIVEGKIPFNSVSYELEEYLAEKNGLREKMINALLEKKKQLEEDKDFDLQSELAVQSNTNDSKNQNAINTRKLRNKRNGDFSSTERSNKKKQTQGPLVSYELSESDLMEDLSIIRRPPNSINSRTKAAKPATEATVEVEDGVLTYNNAKYSKSSRIYVDMKGGLQYTGQITAINPTEMWIKKDDGSKTKIYMSQLKIGKYVLLDNS